MNALVPMLQFATRINRAYAFFNGRREAYMLKISKGNYRSTVTYYACAMISICRVRRLLDGTASVGC